MVMVCAVVWCKKKQDTKSVHRETKETRRGKSTHVQFGVTVNIDGYKRGRTTLLTSFSSTVRIVGSSDLLLRYWGLLIGCRNIGVL